LFHLLDDRVATVDDFEGVDFEIGLLVGAGC